MEGESLTLRRTIIFYPWYKTSSVCVPGDEKYYFFWNSCSFSLFFLLVIYLLFYLFSIYCWQLKSHYWYLQMGLAFHNDWQLPQICDANKTMSHLSVSITYRCHQKLEVDFSSWRYLTICTSHNKVWIHLFHYQHYFLRYQSI